MLKSLLSDAGETTDEVPRWRFDVELLAIATVVLFVTWVLGEAKNQRILRWTGILIPCAAVPLAYMIGLTIGRGQELTRTAELLARFGTQATTRLEEGEANAVHVQIRRLEVAARDCNESYGSISAKPAVSRMNGTFEEVVASLDAPARSED